MDNFERLGEILKTLVRGWRMFDTDAQRDLKFELLFNKRTKIILKRDEGEIKEGGGRLPFGWSSPVFIPFALGKFKQGWAFYTPQLIVAWDSIPSEDERMSFVFKEGDEFFTINIQKRFFPVLKKYLDEFERASFSITMATLVLPVNVREKLFKRLGRRVKYLEVRIGLGLDFDMELLVFPSSTWDGKKWWELSQNELRQVAQYVLDLYHRWMRWK